MKHCNIGDLKILTAISITAVALLSACNTTAGAGKDLSKAGNAITNSAEENKPY